MGQAAIQQANAAEEDYYDCGNRRCGNRFRFPIQTEIRRLAPAVKPAKMNIPEFDGIDPDSWIQTIEQYFDSARTPLEQRTEIAVTYLKEGAMQWWRGTGMAAATLPWHHFTRYVGGRFAENSICDNVRKFHALTQTTTVAKYIANFEEAMNLMRRDNPTLPEDYYISSFISGLSEYIQHHLQCHKPTSMRDAMWFARRIEQANPYKKTVTLHSYVPVRRQVNFELAKTVPTVSPNIIQQAKQKNACYKCKEPWFPGHKQVCKMTQKTQIQQLLSAQKEPADIVYINEPDDDDDLSEPVASPQLQISMHAVLGIHLNKYAFTVSVTIRSKMGSALVDSGSTATFMTPQFAQQTQCDLKPTRKMKVVVADGGHLWIEFTAIGSPYKIQGQEFISDFRNLKLKGYDVILGADWIHQHSPVTLDYKKMTLQATLADNTLVTFRDESLPISDDVQLTANMCQALKQAIY
uniref:Uncharacterized protein n=1 Tax=Avena sativa TaxID=4498 RepID=A0ACD6A7J9_AVESA